MKTMKVVMAICSLALLVLAFTPGLKADSDTWNNKTTMKFNEPFEVPGGQILPAGTYVFKLLQSPSDRDIVQIFNEDQTHVYATVLAIPNYRLDAPGNTIIRFEERTAGSPQAIKAWFHPGRTRGHEFVYPKVRAIELAKEMNEPVPAVAVEPAPVAELEKETIVAESPKGEELPLAQAFEPIQVAKVLPQTASSLPLIGLVGVISLIAAFTLLIITKHIG
jgi:hypothetical protein